MFIEFNFFTLDLFSRFCLLTTVDRVSDNIQGTNTARMLVLLSITKQTILLKAMNVEMFCFYFYLFLLS